MILIAKRILLGIDHYFISLYIMQNFDRILNFIGTNLIEEKNDRNPLFPLKFLKNHREYTSRFHMKVYFPTVQNSHLFGCVHPRWYWRVWKVPSKTIW